MYTTHSVQMTNCGLFGSQLQCIYLNYFAPPQSVVQIEQFFQLKYFSYWNQKVKRKKANPGKKLNVNKKDLQRCKAFKTLTTNLLIMSKIWL